MQTVRPADARGVANFGWLDSRHTFSFGHYHDPQFMGFGPLRVINEDRVQPGKGFGTHGHSDMEIISYVLDGALEHKDSMGTGSVITPGDVQRMSAGTGVQHSEFNASDSELVHFLQIWIMPGQRNLQPSYEQKRFERDDKLGQLRLVGSQDGRDGSVTIYQDVDLYASIVGDGDTLQHRFTNGRKGWLQIARGIVTVNGERRVAGDGVAFDGEQEVTIAGSTDEAELLLFDMTE